MPLPIRLSNSTTEHVSATGRDFNSNSGRILKKRISRNPTASDTEDSSRTINVHTGASVEMKEANGQYGTVRLKPCKNIHGFEFDHSDEGKVPKPNHLLHNI